MKLYCAPVSPFSAKVRMAARYAGATIDEIFTDTTQNPDELLIANPLGKIPTLVTDDGEVLYDSRVIMHYLDSLDEDKRLYPRNPEKRIRTERFEALCDGIMEAAVLVIYEKRYRTTETWHQPWVDRQWGKVMRGLDWIDANPPAFGKRLNAGHFALASLLAYLMLRFPGAWEQHRVRLTRFPATFDEHFPAFSELRPKA